MKKTLGYTEDGEDLEDYWGSIRAPNLNVRTTRTLRAEGWVKAAAQGSETLEGLMATACENSVRKLAEEINSRYDRAPVTGAMLADVVLLGVRMFMREWRDVLADQNLTQLLGVVLDGPNISGEEILGFLHALPQSVLERGAGDAGDSATGTHALISLEILRRSHGLPYTIRIITEFADGPRVLVSTTRAGRDLEFFLDEEFRLPPDGPV